MQIREKLARISARPAGEWRRRLEQEFPDDPTMRRQALLWLHSDKEGPDVEGAPPSLGESADERYELSVRLDVGSTASVWQAFDRRLGRTVAIKVFHERGESEALEQVLAEARAASDVVSEHVVRVLDVQYGDGHPYIVMELVGEYDADKDELVLGATASASRPRSVEEVARWVMHVARGVHEAHLRNVFHRDLKPKNVLVTPNSRRARVADFGLAVSGSTPDATRPAITLLKRGPSGPVSVRGTPEYMAPEQARGLPLSLDPRSADDRAVLVGIDVWGVGAIAYELLTGKPPWVVRRDLSAWEIAASTERPTPIERTRDGERIPKRLRRIIEKALAPDPKDRYTTAASVANELQAFLSQRPTTFDRARLSRFGLWCRRNPQLALSMAVAIGLLALVAGTHLSIVRLSEERDALDREVGDRIAEQAKLNASVVLTRRQLEETRTKLAAERENLATLEKSLSDERSTYEELIQAKEQALLDATASTRRLMEQLEAMRRQRQDADTQRASLEKTLGEMRRDAERAAKDRERVKKEREAARAERERVQRERDEAVAERDALLNELADLKAELQGLRLRK